jgi:hypothetical protein
MHCIALQVSGRAVYVLYYMMSRYCSGGIYKDTPIYILPGTLAEVVKETARLLIPFTFHSQRVDTTVVVFYYYVLSVQHLSTGVDELSCDRDLIR